MSVTVLNGYNNHNGYHRKTVWKERKPCNQEMGKPDGCVRSFKRITWQSLIAEFVGTAILVFVGCGSCLTFGVGVAPRDAGVVDIDVGSRFIAEIVPIALTFGLIIATIAEIIGPVSGCHINPAVTMGVFMYGKIHIIKAIIYIILQTVGAIVGAAFVMVATPESLQGNLGTPQINPKITLFQGFFVECFISFVFVMLVCSVCDNKRTPGEKAHVPLAVGFAITSCHLMAISYTGSGMNPARCIGPAALSGTWKDHWVYWIAPLSGGALAGLIYRFIFSTEAMQLKIQENSDAIVYPVSSPTRRSRPNSETVDSGDVSPEYVTTN